ncbi:hypothetical protein ACPPVO_01950 [Dactylosporangium sp. McL0621]|uniref:hypothetical protein n=1 Tax=Dactylosporangium sp. McL0621 TaxID=3415678 RepID=UPI003CF08BF2
MESVAASGIAEPQRVTPTGVRRVWVLPFERDPGMRDDLERKTGSIAGDGPRPAGHAKTERGATQPHPPPDSVTAILGGGRHPAEFEAKHLRQAPE